MNDYSIEYAHIYTHQNIDLEHEFSTNILKEVFAELSGKKSLVVMVDDYSFPDPGFQYDKLEIYISKKGFSPDLVIRESQLISACDVVLSKILDRKMHKQITSYIISNKKYPCSLFIATWYLLRLGRIESVFFDTNNSAKKLVNILPKSFAPFEDRALDIIRNTEFKEDISNIENRYFEGRIII
ncbi:MAG: hypothetical protein ACPGTS_01505 [Minisyncoccia bacterium]